MTKKKSLSPRSRSIHGPSSTEAWEFSHHLVPPMTASTTFRLKSLKRGAKGFTSFANLKASDKKPIWVYDRLDEPTTLMLEEQIAAMEGGEKAVCFGSGMGAISALLLSLLEKDRTILAHRTLYGCTDSLIANWLPRLGVTSKMLDFNSKDLEIELKDPSVSVLYFETISNPMLELIDLERIVRLVKRENAKRKNPIRIVVDNTFATPWALRPLEWGVDFAIQSLTKNISGFGTEMGGAVITRKEFEPILKVARKDFGAVIHPSSAWHILVFGVSTQSLRFEQQQRTALKVAQYLESHPKIESVIYPGLKSHPQHKLAKKLLRSPEGEFSPGTMISFRLKGSAEKCERFVDDLAANSYTVTLAVSLGLVKTLVEVPGFMTHSAVPADRRDASSIDPRLIRLSIGLENTKDLISDFEEALKRV
ncbi:MAG TPA: aminotransferase class I/II-fold pyridoxal phosphate-dependent enzyme [Pseudobdellovibrionaceae bacterium]|nr:aminotransferase class I/II-fold pyridoxal phosphate-dependent enzyme [Pseudobdellovibrionaceae bacterium]